jgi:hypothetical protein
MRGRQNKRLQWGLHRGTRGRYYGLSLIAAVASITAGTIRLGAYGITGPTQSTLLGGPRSPASCGNAAPHSGECRIHGKDARSLRHDVSPSYRLQEAGYNRGAWVARSQSQQAICQRFARARASVVLVTPRRFLCHATRELGQRGAPWGDRWGSGVAALGSHGRGHRFDGSRAGECPPAPAGQGQRATYRRGLPEDPLGQPPQWHVGGAADLACPASTPP